MDGMGNHSKLGRLGGLVSDNPALLGVAVIGFSVSFQTIALLARKHGLPGWPVLYPVLVDVGILAMIVESRKAIAARRSDIVPRLLAWALIGLTIYVNAHGAPPHDWLGRALHVVGPALWAALLELTRWRKLARRRSLEGDRIPRSRWLMSPWRTLAMWRRMVLHHVTSYPEAVAREDARLLGIDLAAAVYGKQWRRVAPALLRHHLSSGTLPARVALACRENPLDVPELVEAWVTGSKVQAERARARTAPAAPPVTVPAGTPAQPARTRPAPRPAVRQQPTAEVVLAAREALPNGTNEEIAKLAGVSVRTVQRHPYPLHAVGQ